MTTKCRTIETEEDARMLKKKKKEKKGVKPK
jgi:hypothetical protein